MSNNPTTSSEPGVKITDVSNGIHPIEGVNTSITAFIGLAKKGPTNKPIKISSFADFEKIFGSILKDYHLGYCVQHFFLNGGTLCYVTRVQSLNGRQYVSDKTVLGKPAVNLTGRESILWTVLIILIYFVFHRITIKKVYLILFIERH